MVSPWHDTNRGVGMPGHRTRIYGGLWLLAVGGGASLIDPALRSGTFFGALALALVGWLLAAGLGDDSLDRQKPAPAAGGVEREALVETGGALARCGDEFSTNFDATSA